MANPEHLQILKQGAEAWNAWRSQNEGIRPDLRDADLSDTNLREANLCEANVASTDFSRADLTHVNLTEANLWGAFLTRTNLAKASLARAQLIHTTFAGANLGDTDLIGAYFLHANLVGADFSGAGLSETVFINTDLTDMRGLETCIHLRPSTLDHRTLAKSGPLPLTFLRGCGLPDALIDYLPSLLAEPVQFYCFISHASKDQAFAKRLYADLQNNGIRCFYAPENLPIGAKIRASIDESIRVCDQLILILSRHSVASQWVEQEVETALARERQQGTTILFPVRIDNTVMAIETGWPALIRNTRNIGDFRRWKTHDVYQKAFDRLLRDLTAAER
jgi:uncharacterized protein YjbI with pentapeptide repeats